MQNVLTNLDTTYEELMQAEMNISQWSFPLSVSAESTRFLAEVRVPGTEGGAVAVGVVAVHTLGRGHALPQAAAEAALSLVAEAGVLRQGGAVGELVPAGVGHVGGEAVTQTTALKIFCLFAPSCVPGLD